MLALTGVTLAARTPPQTTPAAEPTQHVLFMCPHGAAKSVLASAYFERLAREKGLNVRVDARGTEPDPRVSPKVAEHLTKNGYRVPVRPAAGDARRSRVGRRRDLARLRRARAAVRAGTLRQWDEVPGPGEDFAGADAAIQRRVAELVDELLRQAK